MRIRSRLVVALVGGALMVLTSLSAGAQTDAPADTTHVYTIDLENSQLNWIGRKASGQHDGGFRNFEGTLTMEGNDPSTLAVRVAIDTTSIWADNPNLTNHLQTDDFFAVETHPRAVFESDTVWAYGDQWMVAGDLELHGVTSRLSFPVTLEMGDGSVHATAEFPLYRFDWGISLAGRPGDLILNQVDVRFDITATD